MADNAERDYEVSIRFFADHHFVRAWVDSNVPSGIGVTIRSTEMIEAGKGL